jgi:hypothetical protein
LVPCICRKFLAIQTENCVGTLKENAEEEDQEGDGTEQQRKEMRYMKILGER